MAKAKQHEPSFEAGLKRLEEVLDSLEHGDLSLEEAMRAFEEGVQSGPGLPREVGRSGKAGGTPAQG